MEEKKKFYITTPIYYPSGNWHIGHCYTTVICDAFARYHKMKGEEVFFLTGTDEHGQKVEKKAKACGVTPKEFVDPLVAELKEVWKRLDIDYNRFIRTTDPDHVAAVQKIYEKLYEKGEIYKAEYSGWYCTPCESFWTESQLVDGKCPDCGRAVSLEKEESYFFRLSKYGDKIRKLYEDNPEFLQPKSRVNEMVNNFLKPGLQDLCVSRTSISWGIPLPFDPKHVAYVWIDALSNYITALGAFSEDESLFKKFWPANLHMVGKEIVRFHAIIWPAILMALGIDVPGQVYGHGWLLIGGDKLSKSKQDKVTYELTNPHDLVNRYGCDALRYFLLREIPFGSDGIYTNESLLNRINADLANSYGNLVSRTTAMINQYFGGILPEQGKVTPIDKELIDMATALYAKVDEAVTRLNAPDALSYIFDVIGRANKYIDETTPWILARDESKKDRLGSVLYNLAETIRICTVLLKPFITKAPNVVLNCLGAEKAARTFESLVSFGALKAGSRIEKAPPIFPRIDVKKEVAEIEKLVAAEKAATKKDEGKAPAPEEKAEETAKITIDDFAKVELKVGEIIACERVPKSSKLLHETVKFGEETRSICSGIAKFYSPEALIGKKAVFVTNLPPRNMCGFVSEGMILCAEDENGTLSIVTPEKDVLSGAKLG